MKIFDINSLFILLGLVLIVIGAIYIGSMFSTPPPFFQRPFEQIFRPMLIVGAIFLIFGLYLIYILERGQNEGIKFKEIDV